MILCLKVIAMLSYKQTKTIPFSGFKIEYTASTSISEMMGSSPFI